MSFSAYVLCNVLDQCVCGNACGCSRDPNKTLTFAVFEDHSILDLDVPKVHDAAIVETERKCLLICVKKYQCFSANIVAFARPDGNLLCALLSTDKYSGPELSLEKNHSFHHYCIEVTLCFHSVM